MNNDKILYRMDGSIGIYVRYKSNDMEYLYNILETLYGVPGHGNWGNAHTYAVLHANKYDHKNDFYILFNKIEYLTEEEFKSL